MTATTQLRMFAPAYENGERHTRVMNALGLPEIVYLLHFDEALINGNRNARVQHYIGWTPSVFTLVRRIAAHQSGDRSRSSALTAAAARRGIGIRLVRIWEAPPGKGRAVERAKKGRHGGRWAWCPECNPPSAAA